MNFDNQPLTLEQLPQIEQITFEKLNKEYLWMRITFIGVSYLVLMASGIIYNFFAEKFQWWWIPLALSLLFLWWIMVEVMGFRIKGYVIRKQDISYKSGWIFFSMVSVPFNRIQHSEVAQGPIERMFDLAKVKVYTAGGASSDISIPGLSEAEANQLKEHINSLSSQHV